MLHDKNRSEKFSGDLGRIFEMTKQVPVQTLLDLSKMRLDEATRLLGELISGEQVASERLKLLVGYRVEYHARFMATAQRGIDRDSWRNYSLFLEKLDASIVQAEQAVEQSRQRTALGQREWVGKKDRLRAFDTIAQRHQTREQRVAQHSEQKMQDEFAARKFDPKEEFGHD
jgi:flagellar FliJ protein